MHNGYKAIQISDHVYWVGAIDWELADFHGYATDRGSTYNAFLIMADKITLIDTVKAQFAPEMLSRIADVIDPGKIDYIISNHSEMDHSGALPVAIKAIRPKNIFASPKGVETLKAHLTLDEEITPVKDGESLNLGNMSLKFIDTKMVHWPESMFTLLEADGGVLFSNDAFGMHLAGMERFADQIDDWVLRFEAQNYYANILWPTSGMVAKVLSKINDSEAEISIIAPDHGPVWRENIQDILDLYESWSVRKMERKSVIVYDTMWGSTAQIARAIAEGLVDGGMQTTLMPLSKFNRSDVANALLEASTLVVGSPNLNGGIFPSVADVLTYIKGLKPKNHKLFAATFGSYGWSPAATKQINGVFEEMKADIIVDPLNIQWKPDGTSLEQAFEFGKKIAGNAG